MTTLYLEKFCDIEKNFGDFLPKERGSVTALGFFDGVHTAHRELIRIARKCANNKNVPLVIFTFSEESQNFKSSAKRLFTDEEKLLIFEGLGVDFTVVCDFAAVRELSAEEFVKNFLIAKLNTLTAVSGFNFRFGKGALGDSATLENLMKECGREALILDEYKKDGVTVSSSLIRTLLEEKKLLEAARLLGEPYFLTGKVVHGLGLGINLGFPTVNISLEKNRFALPKGVFLTLVSIRDSLYLGITNVGSCPTFEEREVHTETFILDFDGDIYDENIKVYFIDYLREEKKFSSAEELIMQINVDKNRAKELVKEIQWQEIGLNLR
ncbi:MAG: bifunctional riboflavin kinase/FAD synthetase [Clostridia bacterium]|nr:bifunctional riboflavin kinase/FAD synthetase [Clostridia bacterium]